MKGTSAKLTFVLVLMASASFIAPFGVEAKRKHKQCGGPSSPRPFPSSPLPSPTPTEALTPLPSPPTEAPTPLPSPPTEAPTEAVATPPPPYEYYIGEPVPPGWEAPPYQPHDCGYGPCMDSNDCDWPCTECCANHTCCYEVPFPDYP